MSGVSYSPDYETPKRAHSPDQARLLLQAAREREEQSEAFRDLRTPLEAKILDLSEQLQRARRLLDIALKREEERRGSQGEGALPLRATPTDP